MKDVILSAYVDLSLTDGKVRLWGIDSDQDVTLDEYKNLTSKYFMDIVDGRFEPASFCLDVKMRVKHIA